MMTHHALRPLLFLLIACADQAAAPSDPNDVSNPNEPGEPSKPSDPNEPEQVDDCPNRTAPVGQPQGPIPFNEVFLGNLTISTQLEHDIVQHYRFITGNLTINANTFSAISLPNLEAVAGAFRVQAPSNTLTTINLPALETVGGSLSLLSDADVVTAPRLETLGTHSRVTTDEMDLHCITTVGGSLDINLRTATTLDLDKLRTADPLYLTVGQVTAVTLPSYTAKDLVVNGEALTSVTAPLVVDPERLAVSGPMVANVDIAPSTTIGGLVLGAGQMVNLDEFASVTAYPDGIYLRDMAELTDISALAGVTNIGPISVVGLAKLTNLDALDGAIPSGGDLEIKDNLALTRIGLPGATRFVFLHINRNAALVDLGLPNLVTLSDVSSITTNPQLPTCQALALKARTGGHQISVSGNGTGTCP